MLLALTAVLEATGAPDDGQSAVVLVVALGSVLVPLLRRTALPNRSRRI